MKIDFTINGFSDALILPDEHGFSNVEIEAMKWGRYDKWYEFITNPPPMVITEQVVEE